MGSFSSENEILDEKSEIEVEEQLKDLKIKNDDHYKVKSDIDNATIEKVVLMDISSDKNWICYVHHSRDNDRDISITRRRLKAFGGGNTIENVATVSKRMRQDEYSSCITIQSDPEQRLRKNNFDFTEFYQGAKKYTKFLSISPDGKYIAFSYFEESNMDIVLKKGKSRCIIFEVQDNSIVYYTKLEDCNGRAVFLDRQSEKLCLGIMNTDTLEIYSEFSRSNKRPSHFYDLGPFGSSSRTLRESIAIQESYIKEHISWVDLSDSIGNADAMKIVTLSKHIRYDVLLTPFVYEGIVRLWSIKDNGVRLTSFSAPNEHILALSKDLKYAATITDGIREVKIYNVKNGLLVYTLQSRFEERKDTLVEVTHARFCYESRYIALSGFQEKLTDDGCITEMVFFEVWYIEAEKLIYRKKCNPGGYSKFNNKTVKPFVHRDMTKDGKKCLKGIYTYFKYTLTGEEINEIRYIELRIDDQEEECSDKQVKVKWIDPADPFETPYKIDDYEIQNSVTECEYLKCGKIFVGDKEYLIRFGNRMVQLWILGNPDASVEEEKHHRLIYIRAYKGPNYGLAYSFRDTWEIYDFESIKFVGGTHVGRIIVNIKQNEESLFQNEDDNEKVDLDGAYHTEEIFLPIVDDREDLNKFDYHTFESACQALHYLNFFWESKRYKSKISDKKKKSKEDKFAQVASRLKAFTRDRRDKEIQRYLKKEEFKTKLLNLFEQTYALISKAITEKTFDDSNFFTTMAGSRTLAMLASFSKGRDVIKIILKSKAYIPICLFSFPKSTPRAVHYNSSSGKRKQVYLLRTMERPPGFSRKNGCFDYRNSPKIYEEIKGSYSPIAENENVLTILIEELKYNLYNLIFNRILFDSKKTGPGCLSALADALLFLQEEGNTDLLLQSSQKLSYLAINNKHSISGLLDSEIGGSGKEFLSNLRNLESYAIMEQVQSYKTNWWNILYYLFYKLNMYIRYRFNEDSFSELVMRYWKEKIKKPCTRFFNISKKDEPKYRTTLCVVPLPYFNTYNILLEDRLKTNMMSDEIKNRLENWTKRSITFYKDKSAFVTIASDQNSNNIFKQGDTVLEVMLQYKWKTFVRKRFVGVCLIHIAYYISYCTGVLFAFEMYGYDSADDERSIIARPEHLISLIVMSISGFTLLGQEIHQILRSKRMIDYFSSGYNWMDLLAFIFPFMTLLQLILNWSNFYELCSVSTLILWWHGILRLRVIAFVGIALETIIQLSQKVWSILFILFLVVVSFTHTFIVLLRRREDDFFQENHNGTTSLLDTNNITMTGETTLYDISSSNGFADPFKAFYQVWMFIFGVWDSITNGEAGDDKMLFALCILFSFITVLIFTNMVIAIMSSIVDEVKNKGKAVWVSHFAAVVAEIEQLWCFPSTKRSRDNNPAYIYYYANYLSVLKQEKKLNDETRELKKIVLGIEGGEND